MARTNLVDKPRCVIVGAGVNDSRPELDPEAGLVIAADGGADFLASLGITPDFMIGDFDSSQERPNGTDTTIVLPTEKDDTDMTSAVKLGWEKGFRRFHIYGGLGGRLDHTLANIQLAAALAAHGGVGFLHSRGSIVTAIANGTLTFELPTVKPSGTVLDAQGTQAGVDGSSMVSVFSHSNTSEGVSITGLKYSVTNTTLSNTKPLGVSNEFIAGSEQSPTISVTKGILTVTYPSSAHVSSVSTDLDSAASFGQLTTSVSSLLAH